MRGVKGVRGGMLLPRIESVGRDTANVSVMDGCERFSYVSKRRWLSQEARTRELVSIVVTPTYLLLRAPHS